MAGAAGVSARDGEAGRYEGTAREDADSAVVGGGMAKPISMGRHPGLEGLGATQAAYTLAPQAYGSLISQRRSGATSFHHYDALGSTNKLTDSAEDTEVEYLYKAFGEQSILSGSSDNPFTWVGQLGYYRQSDASDYWVRARVMNPVVGRWVSRPINDALLAELDLLLQDEYIYDMNQPMHIVDPSGHDGAIDIPPGSGNSVHPAICNPEMHIAAIIGCIEVAHTHLPGGKKWHGWNPKNLKDTFKCILKNIKQANKHVRFYAEHKVKEETEKARQLKHKLQRTLDNFLRDFGEFINSPTFKEFIDLLIIVIILAVVMYALVQLIRALILAGLVAVAVLPPYPI